MKQLTKLFLVSMLVIFASCEKDSTQDEQNENQAELRFDNGRVISDGEEDKDLMFNADSETIIRGSDLVISGKSNNSNSITQVYDVIDADRDPFGSQQPSANFWWSENAGGTDYFNASTYFAAAQGNNLVFTEYSNGTASIVGTTISGTCVVEVNVVLKDKKTWAEWSAEGGEHKKEGTAGNVANAEDMNYYVIDSANSTITANGGDCVQEGAFGLRQRPDPNDENTPNYGGHVGPGGANYDSNIGDLGLSTWGWLTDPNTGEDLWLIDFNFRIVPQAEVCSDCYGKVNDLTLNWNWHNDYRVRVYQRYENTCYATKIFDGVVGQGDEIAFSGSNSDGSIGRWAYVYVGNCYYTKFRTDCYLNIGPGYTRGVLEVTSGTSSNGGELCEYSSGYNCYW
jgi:hypothetical protein